MTNKTRSPVFFFVLAVALTGCDGSSPTAPSVQTAVPVQQTLPSGSPAYVVADVTLSGVVSEMTLTGKVPIEGALVANGEGTAVLTGADGFFSFGPLWTCPCAAQPWIEAGMTLIWVGKDGYEDPPGQPASRFPYTGPGDRDVMINGDTRLDVTLVRR